LRFIVLFSLFDRRQGRVRGRKAGRMTGKMLHIWTFWAREHTNVTSKTRKLFALSF